MRALAFIEERGTRRAVDYKNLGSEELGSVYESLLELHPELNVDAADLRRCASPPATSARRPAATTRRRVSSTPCSTRRSTRCSTKQRREQSRGSDPCPDRLRPRMRLRPLPRCRRAPHREASRSARTGDEEPSPEATRTALRDVVGRCLYGVDINPMAVELCKVALWMEALEPGRPLSFLDAHVRQGNSLLGCNTRPRGRAASGLCVPADRG